MLRSSPFKLSVIVLFLLFSPLFPSADDEAFTRGVGIYPGRVGETASPILVPGPDIRRNLALYRPVLQSSAYDHNLTGQLVTDGLVTHDRPRFISFSTSEHGLVDKISRERLFDGNWVTALEMKGSARLAVDAPLPWIRLDLGGEPPTVDALELRGMVRAGGSGPENWTCLVWGSDDRKTWRELGLVSGMTHIGGEFLARINLGAPTRCRAYRIELADPRAQRWTLQEWSFFHNRHRVPVAGPHAFASVWKGAGAGEEWLTVDLGVTSTFDRVVLDWVQRPSKGFVQVSEDGLSWKTILRLPGGGGRDDLTFHKQTGRYVKLLMTRPLDASGCEVSEMAVWGRGGLIPQPRPQPGPDADGDLELTAGNWRLERDSRVSASGEVLSGIDFSDQTWLPATVPGTVLVSYLNAGVLGDPDFGDQQNRVSDAFFQSDFWYRNTFTAPGRRAGERQWLCFDGVNWKATVYLNGQRLGRIEGAFARGRFDVTDLLVPGRLNALAVRVEKTAHPGSVKEKTLEKPGENGGELGRDNPTFHASIGWDWIPTIRGRNTGIWDRVRLITRGEVTLERPMLTTVLPLPDTSMADLSIEVSLRHQGETPVSGRLVGRLGEIVFEETLRLAPGTVQTVKLDPSTHPALRIRGPQLWWPNGYGEPHLYPVVMRFLPDGSDRASDTCRFSAGLRQFTASPDGEPLRLWINGRRFVPKGGNWGFSESMLRYRSREFDAALRYHREMNFNMVRNWLGMTGQDAFYEACDRHGIVVWQDFWLANPWDGDDPDDSALFLSNAEETVYRVRTHPCIGLYCGRNEGYPPWPMETALRALVKGAHGDLVFVPSSADGAVGGYGPYQVQPLEKYGTEYAGTRLHSEMGMPNIPGLESLRRMMPPGDLWPIGRMWGVHDFCLDGAQGGRSFLERLSQSYGETADLESWNAQAQLLNYDGYRAMFEGQNLNRQGLLIWMSHPAWPSTVWQTYDWFLEPTAAYFGARKACEPIHIQWHESSGRVMAVNTSAGDLSGLTARARLYNLDGTLVREQSQELDSPEDSTRPLFTLEHPEALDPVYLLRLSLEQGDRVLSENDYLRGRTPTDTQGLKKVPAVRVEMSQTAARVGDEWVLQAVLRNASAVTALQLHLSAARQGSGDRILPALFSDNYFHLLPGETKSVTVSLRHEDTRGEAPVLRLQGFNL